MSIIWSPFLILLMSAKAISAAQVTEESHFCRLTGSHLDCDFKNYDDIVQVGLTSGRSLDRVIIRSAMRVEVRVDICVNLSFVNVHRVTLKEPGSLSDPVHPLKDCSNMNVIIHNSSVEKLPLNTRGISVTSSYISHLTLPRLRGYIVSNFSVFGIVNISEAVTNQTLYFKDSVIQNLSKLEMNSKTSVYLVNTAVLHCRPNALSFGDGSSLLMIPSEGVNLRGPVDLKPGSLVNIYGPAHKISFVVSGISQSENLNAGTKNTPTERPLSINETLLGDNTYIFILCILLLLPGNLYLCICFMKSMTGSSIFSRYLLVNEKTNK
ncbi:uncharacterized protein [Palaemon carinicauda]|uniref:uncharacterized protein n=1 Tax=Palaemon carinicauda TaxID=392227 RepID=UPI0035B5E118